MALSINSLLSMGNGALFASQAGIQVTGNNISNIYTPGYARQYVDLQERDAVNLRPGQVGQGVEAKQILRYFDRFVEDAFLDKSTLQHRYEEQYNLLRTVETIFNESKTPGLNNALSNLFKQWSKLAQTPNNEAARQSLLASAQGFAAIMRNTDQTLADLELKLDGMITSDVSEANRLMQEIASLNAEIGAQTIPGSNNVNSLLDERDRKIQALSTIIDVKVEDHGLGKLMVKTCSGLLLVQDDKAFALSFNGPRVENSLNINSQYNGSAGFTGSDGYEYTVEIIQPGIIDSSGANPPMPGTAQYRVSLDGGKSWLQNDQGNNQLFYATNEQNSTHVKNLDIYFTGTNMLEKGDKFLLTPKSDVFWISPTKGPIDISTQIYDDDTENTQRITGGRLAGFLDFRDRKISVYRDNLAAFCDTLIWETNRLHSQGAGTKHLSNLLGTYEVKNINVPLGARNAGFHWFDKVQAGNVTFAIYDAATGKEILPYPGINVLAPQNFDPSQHSLQNVCDAINSGLASSYVQASISDNRLHIAAQDGYTFDISADTTGLAAALGLNTFFKGEYPGEMTVREELLADPGFVNAGRVDGAGEANRGNNITANDIASLLNKPLDFTLPSGKKSKLRLGDFYGSVVARIGADTAKAGFQATSERTMAQELHNRREEISGINLDEEMTNLMKFQSAYKAAAKLITTADQMMQTLLTLKQ